jgi:hypothetical protein
MDPMSTAAGLVAAGLTVGIAELSTPNTRLDRQVDIRPPKTTSTRLTLLQRPVDLQESLSVYGLTVALSLIFANPFGNE